MMRKVNYKEKGITLIALVITIIILLILAGVTISTALGQNGLFQRAKLAAETYKEAEEQESQRLEEIYIEIANGEAEQVTDKNPGELAKENNNENVLLVESIEDLVALSENAAKGEKYEDKTIKLTVNLDFQSDLSYANPEKTETRKKLTEGTGYTPIKTFNGTFDGKGHTIKNLYIKTDEEEVGFFKKTEAKSTIKNMILSKANIESTNNKIGALVGTNQGKVENIQCKEGSIKGNQNVGGIIGNINKGSINKCSNSSKVEGGDSVGGIVGLSNGCNIDNCINNGYIVGNGNQTTGDGTWHTCVGGIAGYVNKTTIKNSINTANVISTRGMTIGGICSTARSNSIIETCYNTGNIGILEKGKNFHAVGGIAGSVRLDSTVKECFNIGTVNGEFEVGGIVGSYYYEETEGVKTSISDCYNIGIVNGTSNYVSGIANCIRNDVKFKVNCCYNIGKITCNNDNASKIGGIVSCLPEELTAIEVTNCYYLKETCSGAVNKADITGKAENKSREDMIKDEFVEQLNGDREGETSVWKKDEQNKNQGYPVLK